MRLPVPQAAVHRCGSRSAFVAAIVLATGAAAAPPALAAKPPDWARPVVDSAPPEPEGESPFPERILLLETAEQVQRDGSIRLRHRYATQALRERPEGLEIGWFHFDDATTQMGTHRAWHVPPGKGAKRSRQAPVDVLVGSDFLTDNKARAVPVKDVEKGSIVLFEFEAVETPRILPRSVAFGAEVPIGVQRYVLEVPEGWEVRWDWMGGSGPDPVVSEKIYTWELHDLAPIRDEPMAPALPERQRRLAVNLIPPEGARISPAALGSWADFSVWYDRLAGGRHEADSRVREAATSARSGGDESLLGIVSAEGRYVRDKVRYVAVELGIGGMQPRPAVETLSKLYGDCKDKGTLFRSLLSTSEMDSYPILVNLSYEGMISEVIPAWGFDHFIVAVPLPSDQVVPDSFTPALLETEGLGRFLVVDTTDEKTSIGSLSASLGGKRVLLVAGDRGRLVTLPGRSASDHRIERKLEGALAATGYLSVESVSSYFGEFARRARSSYSASSEDRRKAAERQILALWPEATIERFEVAYENEDGCYVETLGCRLRMRPRAGESRRLEIFPGAGGEVDRVSLGRRESPVVFEHPLRIRYDVRYRDLPAGAEAPTPREESGEDWAVRTTYRLDAGNLEASCEIVLERTRFEPGEFADLREFWAAVSRAASASLKIPG